MFAMYARFNLFISLLKINFVLLKLSIYILDIFH